MTVLKPYLGALSGHYACRRGDMVAAIEAEIVQNDIGPEDTGNLNRWDLSLRTFNVVEPADLVTIGQVVHRIINVRVGASYAPGEPRLHVCYLVEAPNETPDALMVDFSDEFDERDFW